jgi:hypothetical protein
MNLDFRSRRDVSAHLPVNDEGANIDLCVDDRRLTYNQDIP